MDADPGNYTQRCGIPGRTVHICDSSINQCPYNLQVLLHEYIQSKNGRPERPVYEAIAEHPRYIMKLVQKFERIWRRQIQ